MEKLGVAIAGIAIVAGIIIYATSGTSAFSPQPISRTLPNIAVYISDDGDDVNSGRIITEPVRTIRKAAEITNSFANANVSVLFTEEEYEVMYTDMIKSGDYSQQDIVISNPNNVTFEPVSSIEYVSMMRGDNPPTGNYNTLPILCTGKTTNFVFSGFSFVDTSTFPVHIHATEKANLTIQNNKFGYSDDYPRFMDRHALNVWGNQLIRIENNVIYVPNRGTGWRANITGIEIDEMTAREAEVTIINNTFIFPENYESSYQPPYYEFTTHSGIAVMAGQTKVIDNEFVTEGYLSQPHMLYINMHNIGILTGYGAVMTDVVNNNFMHFDGANVVSQSHVENSYPDSNKQNVILRDNYMGRI